MGFSLGKIAAHVGAQLEGNGALEILRLASLEEAGAGELCFADSPKKLEAVQASEAGAIVVGLDFPETPGRNLLRAENPRLVFLYVMEMFVPKSIPLGVHPSAVISSSAQLDANVSVGPCAVIDEDVQIGSDTRLDAGVYIGRGVKIGSGCHIEPNVSLFDGVVLGDRCIVHAGAVIGGEGFGYQWLGDHHHKIPQLGNVVIEDDVNIGCNTCIDRATLDTTRIRRGSKIDNLVQIGHNNDIGEHVILVSQVGVSGSVKIGTGAVLGGQVGVADHLEIGAGSQIGAQGGVTCDIKPGEKIWGTPSRPMKRVLREQAALGKLPELLKQFRGQERLIGELLQRIEALENPSVD